MKRTFCGRQFSNFIAAIIVFISGHSLRADQVEMANGDRYQGRILSLTADTLFMQNVNLGMLRIPRTNVNLIALGTNALPVSARMKTEPAKTNAAPDLGQITSDPKVIETVRNQYLQGASPEASAKFNELLSGLGNGSINLNDLRTQAKNAVDQLRQAKVDMGGDNTGVLDSYMEILNNFLKESPEDVPPK